jgi:hypothetical protein
MANLNLQTEWLYLFWKKVMDVQSEVGWASNPAGLASVGHPLLCHSYPLIEMAVTTLDRHWNSAVNFPILMSRAVTTLDKLWSKSVGFQPWRAKQW